MIPYRKYLFITAGLFIAAAVFLLSSVKLHYGTAGSGDADADGPVLGYVQLPGESVWWDEFDSGLRREAEKLGMQILAVPSDWSQEGEISAIRTLLSYRVDVIVFCPVITGGWDSVLNEAEAAGVPLLTFISTISSQTNIHAVTEDLNTQGSEAVRFLTEACAGRTEPLRIVELRGLSSSSSSIALSGALRRNLARVEEEGLLSSDIVYSAGAGVMYSKARELLNNYLKNAHADNRPDVIFCFNDAITRSVVSVLEEYDLRVGRDVYVLAFAPGSDTLDLLREGRISWTYLPRSFMAEAAGETAAQLAAGETAPAELVLEGEAIQTDVEP